MSATEQRDIDERIQAYYGEVFDEQARLTTRSAQGPLEFHRTQELIRAYVPTGRVLDVGGGAGVHARALADDGYEVELIDAVPRHIRQATDAGVRAQLGDARDLPYDDDSFDAVIMLGPLELHGSVDDAVRDAALVLARGLGDTGHPRSERSPHGRRAGADLSLSSPLRSSP